MRYVRYGRHDIMLPKTVHDPVFFFRRSFHFHFSFFFFFCSYGGTVFRTHGLCTVLTIDTFLETPHTCSVERDEETLCI